MTLIKSDCFCEVEFRDDVMVTTKQCKPHELLDRIAKMCVRNQLAYPQTTNTRDAYWYEAGQEHMKQTINRLMGEKA